MGSALDRFSPATRTWFDEAFSAPTLAQSGAWDAIGRGSHALVVAPTGSGKTLAAFLSSLDALHAKAADDEPGTRVLYISPLKALGVDVERNLRAPLVGIARVADRLGIEPPHVSVGVRSGDTPASDRRTLQKSPPDILITTPESLFLMLTSAARDTLRTVETVIVDEIHAVAGTKRGAHLAVSLERLDELLEKPAQRIGLSATVRPPEEVARFLCASAPVEIVAPASEKRFDLRVVVPVDDMADLPPAPEREGATSSATPQTGSIWPHVEEAIVDRVLENRSSIVFANSRRLAERLTARLNEIYAERTRRTPRRRMPPLQQPSWAQAGQMQGAEPLLARAHHGSVSKEQRAEIEDDLKSGRLRCVVATSSLELGIDMGAVDLVVQVESPPSVASGLQRVGRAGHQVGEVSRGVIFPKHRADLVHAAVTAERMLAGAIETLHIPANPLDILAQQTVAAVALDQSSVDDWFDTVRRSAPFSALPRSAYEATLDLLAGRYPSDQFAELRPRIVWDREAGHAHRASRRPAPRRHERRHHPRPRHVRRLPRRRRRAHRPRVGELDEEMVYESRVGDVFALGATSWRIQEITHDRVNVTPGVRPAGAAAVLEGRRARPTRRARSGARRVHARRLARRRMPTPASRIRAGGLDDRAATQPHRLPHRPARRRRARCRPTAPSSSSASRDELGDWRVILHSPYGMHVHAPWALAVGARVRERHGIDGASIASDDGIIVRIPDTEVEPPGAELFVFEADELEQLVTDEVGGSALFASRFRECAARALLLPHYRPGTRSPLWQQRQKSAQLLDVARTFPTFPIILETLRECLQDVYDLPSLLVARARDRLARHPSGRDDDRFPEPVREHPAVRLRRRLHVRGRHPARRATGGGARHRLDPARPNCSAGSNCASCSTRRSSTTPSASSSGSPPIAGRKGLEGIADLLRGLGALSVEEISARVTAETLPDVAEHVDELLRAKRIIRTAVAGADRLAAIEDVGRLRDALGVPIQVGVPEAFLEAVADPLGDLISRYARTHGPFATEEVAERLGIGIAVARSALRRLVEARRLVEGEFRPNGTSAEWCDAEVLRRLRRRSLAALRHEIEPVEQRALARFLPVWQHVGGRLRGLDGVASVIEQLEGARLPASAWESLVLPARVSDYSPAMLDELMATGEVVWCGSGALAGDDGWISLHLADTAALTLPISLEAETTPLQREVLASLGSGGAFFFRQLSDAVGSEDDSALVDALWDLAWSGLVTNDTFAPVRALVAGGHSAHKPQRAAPRARMHRGRALPRAKMPSRGGPPTVAGRWSILPLPDSSATRRAHALGETLLERYGVVTRGAAVAEGVIGGFALVYRTLREFEESGRSRRGYFVDKLGAAQFAAPGAVDRLRSHVDRDDGSTPPAPVAFTLAATDPANPFGAALAWPALPEGTTHRPARKAGALVVLVDGTIALYVERGGKTMLAFTDDEAVLAAAAASLAAAVSRGGMRKLAVETVNGLFVLGAPAGLALRGAGFSETPRGLRLSARV